MIKVTENEQKQLVITCDTADEFGIFVDCVMSRMANGNKQAKGLMLMSLAIMPMEEAIKTFQSCPMPKFAEPLKGFWKDTITMMKTPGNELNKPAKGGETNKDLAAKLGLEGLLDVSSMPKPRFNPEL